MLFDFKREMPLLLLCLICSYLMGSINFAILLSKFFSKKDIRNLGSGNAGFSNMLRSVGVLPSVITFLGDFAKGAISMIFGILVCKKFHYEYLGTYLFLMIVELFCCLGHMFPCFFKFRGGKGILTTWACIFFVDWRVAIILISIFLISLTISKIVSLSSIIVSVSYPLLVCVFNKIRLDISIVPFIISLLVSLMIIIRHKDNIIRLIHREEKKINLNKGQK